VKEHHSARDMVVRDKARIMLYKESGKDVRLGRSVRGNWNATTA
jgi:hypothetical protein